MTHPMTCRAVAVASALLIALLALPHGKASAQMTKDQQKCANAMNKDFSKVSKAHGKALGDCVKNNAKGSLTDPTVSACFANPDKKGKVQKASGKTGDDYIKNCVGNSKNDPNSPKLPTWGVTDPNVANAAAVYNELELMQMLFGPDRDTVLLAEKSSDPNLPAYKDQSKCQQTVVKALGKCQATMLKEFNKCKKDGLKSRAITDASGLEACVLGLWSNPKVSPACGAKLSDAIGKKCSGLLDDPNLPLFPGDCDGDANLAECLGRQIWFDTCMALNDVDGLSLDCIMATGANIGLSASKFNEDAFCVGGPDDGEPCTDVIAPYSECGGFSCIQTSYIGVSFEAGPKPLLTVPLSGESRVRCGVVDPGTGVADCSTELDFIEGFDLSVIGYICFDTQSAPQCPATFIDCDGGTPASVTTHINHYVGACGLADIGHDPNDQDPNNYVGYSECVDLCDTYCASLPGNYQMHWPDCEGYCAYGPREFLPCQFDAECPGGNCVGSEPVVHENSCNCTCLEIGGDPSPPGTLLMNVLAQLIIYEPGAGACLGRITEVVSPTCEHLTTQTADSIILNANRFGGLFSGGQYVGSPMNCNDMAYGRADALAVGHRDYLDTGMGDQESAQVAHMIPRPLSP